MTSSALADNYRNEFSSDEALQIYVPALVSSPLRHAIFMSRLVSRQFILSSASLVSPIQQAA